LKAKQTVGKAVKKVMLAVGRAVNSVMEAAVTREPRTQSE